MTRRWDRRVSIGGLVVQLDRGGTWRAGPPLPRARRRGPRSPALGSTPILVAPVQDRALDELAVIPLAPRVGAQLAGAPCAVFARVRLALIRIGPRIAVRADADHVSVERRPGGDEARVARDEIVEVWSRPGQIYLRLTGGRGIALVLDRAPERRDRWAARRLAARLGVPFTDDACELPVARAWFGPPGGP